MTQPDLIQLTRDLIRFDTINPPGHEEDCAHHLAEILEAGGIEVQLERFGPGRVNLVARLAGGDGNAPLLCFTGHLDTVPLGAAQWERDPFGGEIADGRLYGRGSCDMKGGVAAMVLSALDLAAAGSIRSGLILLLTGGEETGCEGASHFARPARSEEVGAVVVGEPTDNSPLIGHKGALWLEASTHGVTAHGSVPHEGENAIYKAARAIRKLEAFDFDVATHGVVGNPTLNLGTIRGGLNTNSVPDLTTMTIDIRTVPGQHHDRIRCELERHMGEEVHLKPMIDLPGVFTTAEDPWVRHALDICCAVTGERQTAGAAAYFTDASVLKPAFGEPPTIILGPGHPTMAHRTDEWCSIERLKQAREIYTRLAFDWCLRSADGFA